MDPLRDITPVIQISGVTFHVVVPADSSFRSLAGVVAWAQAHSGRLTIGSTGVGSTAHLAMEEIIARAGASYVHVLYKGTADQMLAVARETFMVGVNSTGFAPYVDSGKLRLLAVFNAQRSKRWPAVPTVAASWVPVRGPRSPYGRSAGRHRRGHVAWARTAR